MPNIFSLPGIELSALACLLLICKIQADEFK
jgi:hypothetical protein